MKRNVLNISLFALLATACGSGQMQFSTERLRYAQTTEKAEVEVTIDYPENGGIAIADSLRSYINQWLGDSYEGSLDEGQAMADYYGQAYLTDLESQRPGVETQKYLRYVIVSMECNQEKYVSYTIYDESFNGGAHGFHTQQGYTFDKTTGSLLSCDYIEVPEDSTFQQLLREGLETYFGPYPIDEWLWADDEILPMPQCPPFLDKNGITFIYQPYEIAPYAAGMPFITIPYEKVMPFLTPEIKALLTPSEP